MEGEWIPEADTDKAGQDEVCCVCLYEFSEGDVVKENTAGDIVCGEECAQTYLEPRSDDEVARR